MSLKRNELKGIITSSDVFPEEEHKYFVEYS